MAAYYNCVSRWGIMIMTLLTAGSGSRIVENVEQEIIANDPSRVVISFKSFTLLADTTVTAILKRYDVDVEIEYLNSSDYASPNLWMLTGSLVNITDSLVYGFIDNFNRFQGGIRMNRRWLMIEPDSSLERLPDRNHYVIYDAIPARDMRRKHRSTFDVSSRNVSRFCRNDAFSEQPLDNNATRYPRSFAANTTDTCLLYFMIDHTALRHTKSSKTQMNTMILKLQLVLREVNDIYRGLQVSLNGKALANPVKFKLKHVAIMTEDQCPSARNPKSICDESLDINNLLHAHSIADYDKYCLAYVLTARDFQGVLGLAYTSAPGRLGGVCARHVQGRSLNAGLVSIINGQRQISRITLVTTLAHELAHNLGSDHDPDDDGKCSPGGSSGNYLMYSHATNGYQNNNRKFSQCTVKDISKTIQRLADGHIFNCLVPFNASMCGNGQTEDGEQCDCGYSDSCKAIGDKCCYPADHKDESLRCKLTSGSECSPSIGPCCSEQCRYASSSTKCSDSDADACKATRYCSGNSATCPKAKDQSDNLPNGQLCSDGTGTCLNGLCAGSVCNHFNTGGACELSDADMREMKPAERMKAKCSVYCLDGKKCVHLEALAVKKGFDMSGVHSVRFPGSICDNGKGYCDIFQLCQPVDNDSPITRLTIDLSKKIISVVKKHWIIAVVVVILILLLAVMLIKYCGKYTPSNNPDMKRHKRLLYSRNAAPTSRRTSYSGPSSGSRSTASSR